MSAQDSISISAAFERRPKKPKCPAAHPIRRRFRPDENGHPHDPGIVCTRARRTCGSELGASPPDDSRYFILPGEGGGKKRHDRLIVVVCTLPTRARTLEKARYEPATGIVVTTSPLRPVGRLKRARGGRTVRPAAERPRRRTRRRDDERERTDAVARRRHSIFSGPVPFERATIADGRSNHRCTVGGGGGDVSIRRRRYACARQDGAGLSSKKSWSNGVLLDH